MASMVPVSDLVWINSDGHKPVNPRIRRIIRQQAMNRAVAQRRYKATAHGNCNVPQCPECSTLLPHDDLGCMPRTSQTDQRRDGCVDLVKAVVKRTGSAAPASTNSSLILLPGSLNSTGYEAMRNRYDFDLLDLSGLTPLHIGKTTAQPLQQTPSRLREVLRCRQWSYFSYLPRRFGNTQCLDDAIRCVSARVRQWLTNPAGPTYPILLLYSKAVTSLQAALDDISQCMSPDVLCAVQILSIFELLDLDYRRREARVRHAAGAATLIRLRGPERYKTDFEKALFLSQASPIIQEALLNVSPCFLETPAWQRLFKTMQFGKFRDTYYSDAYVKAWACISVVPGLFHEVRIIIRDTWKASLAAREELRHRILKLRSRLTRLGTEQRLMSLIQTESVDSPRVLLRNASSDIQHNLLGLYAINLIRLERLIVALDPSRGMLPESRAQDLANQAVDMEETARILNLRASLSSQFRLMTVIATLSTAEDWQQEIYRKPPAGTVDVAIFERWVRNVWPQRQAPPIEDR